MNLPATTNITDNHQRARRAAAAWIYTRKSPHTRDAYRRDLTQWLDWCTTHNVDPFTARRTHVLLWVADLRNQHLADATQARRVASTCSWYEWLLSEELTERNPARLRPEERPQAHRNESPTPVLTTTQTEQLLAAADADPNPRSAATLALLTYSGMRVSELTNADIEDLTIDRGHPVLPITGKGGRKRTVPLPPAVYERLQNYLASRTDMEHLPARTGGANQRRPLIATSTGRRITRSQITRLLQRFARKAGGDLTELAARISPHSLRHSYVTDLLDDGVPLRDVQYAVGHADPRTTERYDRGKLRLDRHPTYRRAAQLGEVA